MSKSGQSRRHRPVASCGKRGPWIVSRVGDPATRPSTQVPPESALSHAFWTTKDGATYTAAYRGSHISMEIELATLGITFKHCKPYHPLRISFVVLAPVAAVVVGSS
jgi:hypothetical protein